MIDNISISCIQVMGTSFVYQSLMTRKEYNADQTAEDMHEIVTTNQHNRKSVKQATRQTAEVTLFSLNHPGCYNSLKRLQV